MAIVVDRTARSVEVTEVVDIPDLIEQDVPQQLMRVEDREFAELLDALGWPVPGDDGQ